VPSDVATLTTFEALLAKGLGDGGSNDIGGAGMMGIGDSGENLIVAGMIVLGKAGLDVFGGGLEEVGLVHKFFILLLAKSMGTVLVVVLVCTVTCAIVEVGEAEGVTPRIWLGIECRLGVGALEGEHSVDEGVGGNGLGSKLVKYLVIAAK
jgi:hypothetical protein